MNGVLVEIRHNKREVQQRLPLDTGTRDAVADFLKEHFPSGTAKRAAREYGLTLDQARSAVAGRASTTTIDQIYKSGGWLVIFAVGARVIGQGADQYLIELRGKHEQQARRLGALGIDLWPLRHPGGDDTGGLDVPEDDRREPVRRRVG